ncbi:helix-turn-helix transcriptional regulator [Mesorhizobium sp. B4-1-3]|uniref:winged helix-turn-helix transcriptional regulator n=1 Tax=Mesorhizobium sp. B4-1-3 TaxID=2589889 RepID=UPI00112741B4|nr:helix-turn-helix domain-containing protein [Mesorhizobium sp. B4-1-3]TPI10815.1 helix-turn-helix transcriptional regulator [Mesorhizobium sp. B4-1-3]
MAQITKKRVVKRLPMLPAERALKVISGRWKAVILYYLFDGPRRLSALKALMPGITQKVLIDQLREMEEHGLVSREIFAEIPVRVEYRATPLGLSLEPILLALCQWGQHHADELDEQAHLADCIIRPRQATGVPQTNSAN